MRYAGKLVTVLMTAAAFGLVACGQGGVEEGETTDDVDVDTLDWDIEEDSDLERESEEAAEEVGEAAREGVEAIGEGLEETGEAIQEGIDTEDERDNP